MNKQRRAAAACVVALLCSCSGGGAQITDAGVNDGNVNDGRDVDMPEAQAADDGGRDGGCVDGGCDSTCGSCVMDPHGVASCEGGQCRLSCNESYVLDRGRCVPRVPQPISPLSSWTAPLAQTVDAFELVARPHAAYVRYEFELCREVSCSTVLWRASSASARSTVPAGIVTSFRTIHWRATGVMEDGTRRVSPTSAFRITVGRWQPVPAIFFDFDADHRSDFIAADALGGRIADSVTNVYFGAPRSDMTLGAVELPMTVRRFRMLPTAIQYVGDFDGDGYSDAVFSGESLQVVFGGARVRQGEIRTSSESRQQALQPYATTGAVSRIVAPLGDINEDGFSDFALSEWSLMPGLSDVHLYLGNAEGALRVAASYRGREMHAIVSLGRCDASRPSPHIVLALAPSMIAGESVLTPLLVTPSEVRVAGASTTIPIGNAVLDSMGSWSGTPLTAMVRATFSSEASIVSARCTEAGSVAITPHTVTLPDRTIVASRGVDLDRDGADEVVLGRFADAAQPTLHLVYAGRSHFDRPTPVEGTYTRTLTASEWSLMEPGLEWMANAAGSPGDVDGDGYDDLPIGVFDANEQPSIRVYYGASSIYRALAFRTITSESRGFGTFIAAASNSARPARAHASERCLRAPRHAPR